MSTRLSFRPRPVDTTRQLAIVRDTAELDSTDGLDPAQPVPAEVKAEGSQTGPAPAQKKKKEVKEIPVPEVRMVPGYTREYLPLFKIPDTYIKGKGGVGWTKDDYVEYDLDNEDEDWLDSFNKGQVKLTGHKLERMIWRLELANAEANQRVLGEPGYTTDWRMMPAMVANISNMSRDDAIAMLKKLVGGREQLLGAVYDYWKGKRERWGKPVMRRLQAPTNPSDTNPYNVFRPREKVNRPQTRRRRENTTECLEKCAAMRTNQLKALEISEMVIFREARKRDMVRLEVEMQVYQMVRHHQPRQYHETAEAAAAAKLQEASVRQQQGEPRLRAYLAEGGSAPSTSYDGPLRRAMVKKRRRQDQEGYVNGDVVARLPPPPLTPDDELLMLLPLDLAKLTAPASGTSGGGGRGQQPRPPPLVVPAGCDVRRVRPRVGRGGRMWLSRCDPLTMELHPPLEPGVNGVAAPVGNGAAASRSAAAAAAAPAWLIQNTPQASQSWATTLDINLLPDGIVDKQQLQAMRDRRMQKMAHMQALLQRHAQTLYQREQSAVTLPQPAVRQPVVHPAHAHAPQAIVPPPQLQPHAPPPAGSMPPPPAPMGAQAPLPTPGGVPAAATPFAGAAAAAPGSAAGRKTPKGAAAAAAAAAAPGGIPGSSRSPSPGGPMLMAKQAAAATPGATMMAPPPPGMAPVAPSAAAAAPPAGGNASAATTPTAAAAAASAGAGPSGAPTTTKKTGGNKGGGAASGSGQLKRGPGRPPKAAKSAANGEGPGSAGDVL